MNTQGQFTLLSSDEVSGFLKQAKVSRSISLVQIHHTYIPSYKHFTGDNHFTLLTGMRRSHLERGFSDIAQHFTTFPDGNIGTGRPLNSIPAGIKGANSNAICIENLGNFDQGGDQMTPGHKRAILALVGALCNRFVIPVDIKHIVYHHWYDLNSGVRNDGNGGSTKSCPGTAFFGGNTPIACNTNFLPDLRNVPGTASVITRGALKHGSVQVSAHDYLNVRVSTLPTSQIVHTLAAGTPVSCYEEKDGWWRIDPVESHWANAQYIEQTN